MDKCLTMIPALSNIADVISHVNNPFSKRRGIHVCQVLTADRINAYNSFKDPDEVKPQKFDAFNLKDDLFTITLPAKSVVVVEVVQ